MNDTAPSRWAAAGAALALFALLQAWHVAETMLIQGGWALQPQILRSQVLIHASLSLCLVVALIRADAAVDRGAHPLLAYGAAAVLASLCAGALQFALHQALDWSFRTAVNLQARALHPLHALRVALGYVIWSALVVYVWAGWRARRLALERMSQAQLARARLQRALSESHWQSLQARVEPQFLFDTLRQVRRLAEHDVALAQRLLEQLVTYLRAALPARDEDSSTLGRELALARSYLALRRPPDAPEPLRAEVAPDLRSARLPPLLLPPLLDRLLGRGGVARLEAQVQASRLDLDVAIEAGAGIPAASELAQDLERLRTVYGEHATLSIETAAGRVSRLRLTLPHEHHAPTPP